MVVVTDGFRIKKHKMKILLTILLFTVCLAADANTYYVSNTGSDLANGTSTSTPWQTISKVMSAGIVAGDSVLFKRGGVWREQLTLPSSGTIGNMIFYGAYDSGAKPIINAANVMTGWTNAGSNRWWINNPNAVTTRAMVIIGGTIYNEVASVALVNSANEYFIDVSTSPDRVYVFSTVDPATLTAEVSNREYCIVTAAGASSRRFIEIADIEVRYAGRAGIYFEGPGAGISDALDGSSIVRRCTGYANRLFGMAHYDHYDNVLFEDCDATYNGNGLYSWVADEGTFRRCITSNQIQYAAISAFTDGGAIQSYQGTNWLVENCTSTNDHDAIHIDAGGVATNAIIRYNKVFNSRPGNPNTPCMGVGSVAVGGLVQFYYNLLVNGSSAAFECFTTISGTVRFYNNTIFQSTTTGTEGVIYLANGAGFDIKNNIIVRDYVPGEYQISVFGAPNITSNYNQIYILNNPGATVRLYYNGVTYTTLAAWRTATSQDLNSISSNPLFVSTTDFRLQTGSPCINAGVNVGLTQDLLGNPITGAPDIGAYEFTTAVLCCNTAELNAVTARITALEASLKALQAKVSGLKATTIIQ